MFYFLLSLLSITLSPIDSLTITKKFTVYTTESQSNNKMVKTESTINFGAFIQPLETQSSVTIDPNIEFQSFLGIGAALTDAAAETFYKLDKDQQDLFLKSYFSEKEGIGYTLARTIIHSCDFSSESYTYIEEGDESL